MTDTAILLVGGRCTRLGSLTDQTPKPLLEVAGQPFIYQVLDHLASQGIKRVIFATGYLALQFDAKVGVRYRDMKLRYSREDTPLGTGGALARAFATCDDERAYVLNGDTLFKADLGILGQVHESQGAAFSLVLRRVADASRYGSIACMGYRVTAMHEKGARGPGSINGGIYLVDRKPLLADAPAEAFSLERDLLPRWVARGAVAGVHSDAYFIDIGIPADLTQIRRDLGG